MDTIEIDIDVLKLLLKTLSMYVRYLPYTNTAIVAAIKPNNIPFLLLHLLIDKPAKYVSTVIRNITTIVDIPPNKYANM